MTFTALNQLPEEILQKIGRNVLLFQQLEGILKLLAEFHFTVRDDLSSTLVPEDVQISYERHVAAVNKQTLGTLATQFAGNIFSSEEASKQKLMEEPYDSGAITISFSLHQIADKESYNASILDAVKARNELIHCFLQKFDLRSSPGIDSAIQYLDKQHEEVLPLITRLQDVLRRSLKLKQKMFDFFTSEVGRKYMHFLFDPGATVVDLLCETSKQKGRSDGWTNLGTAGQILRKQAAEPLDAAMEYYKQRTLKQFLQASGLFELKEEATAKGGVTTLYRIKKELTFYRECFDSIQQRGGLAQ